MRKDEGDEVEAAFRGRDLHFIRVNAADRFLGALKGVTDPEQKRKIIGAEFVRVFEEEARKLPHVRYLAQGNHLPRCHRIRRRQGRQGGDHQESPQCRRSAG